MMNHTDFETTQVFCDNESDDAPVERRAERRNRTDRRSQQETTPEMELAGWDRRRGPGRRRSDDRRDAEEGQMNDEQFAFIMAVDAYRRANKRPFPSLTEILEVLKALGYRKVAEPATADGTADNDMPADSRQQAS